MNLKLKRIATSLASTLVLAGFSTSLFAAEPTKKDALPKPTMSDLIKASNPSDWRSLDPENTLYLNLPQGRVVIELAPNFAPNHVANIKALAREKFFDGLAIVRSHDNYVAQWADPDEKRELKVAKRNLEGEFFVNYAKNLPFTQLKDFDGYAPQVGHANGFPAGRDPKAGTAWLAHCYGAVGVARGNENNSGDGTSLYVVTGHAPRHLDRNITVVGRVFQGVELLSSLPRGKAALGFYEKAEERTPIISMHVAADVPALERTQLDVIRTDTALFQKMIEAQRNRAGDWFKRPAGYVELCNVAIPVRAKK